MSIKPRDFFRKTAKAVLNAGVLAAGLKLLVLLVRAHVSGAFLVLPFWPNVCDALILIIAGLHGLAEVSTCVRREWWKGRGRES